MQPVQRSPKQRDSCFRRNDRQLEKVAHGVFLLKAIVAHRIKTYHKTAKKETGFLMFPEN
jgi:hypothetical protein